MSYRDRGAYNLRDSFCGMNIYSARFCILYYNESDHAVKDIPSIVLYVLIGLRHRKLRSFVD